MQTLVYFLLWGAFIFFMMRFGCGAHVMGHGHGHRHDGAGPDTSSSAGGARWTPPAKDIDPVCGMTVETAGAKSSVYDGHVYYFCSQDCREKFEASPRSYTSGATSSPHTMELSHEHQH
jgi:YHS domain-containing protein